VKAAYDVLVDASGECLWAEKKLIPGRQQKNCCMHGENVNSMQKEEAVTRGHSALRHTKNVWKMRRTLCVHERGLQEIRGNEAMRLYVKLREKGICKPSRRKFVHTFRTSLQNELASCPS
jgi:hypothetical protein